MTRPTDQGMTGIEKRVCHTHGSQEEGPGRPHREAPGSARGRGSEGQMETRAFIVVSMGRNRRGRVDRFWLAI